MTTATESKPADLAVLRLQVDDLAFCLDRYLADPDRGLPACVGQLARSIADQIAKLPTSDD